MTPAQLQPESFRAYPPEARQLASQHIDLLRKLPLSFLPLLLRETIAYDWKFPIERRELKQQFAYLAARPAVLERFARLHIAPELERVDWVNSPAQFSEQLTAHLWATHQIDEFRAAAVEYVAKLNQGKEAAPALPRFGVAAIGRGAAGNAYPLFRKLRAHGVYYSNVDARGGGEAMMEFAAARAEKAPGAFAHWYIDGASPLPSAAGVTTVSYAGLAGTRAKLQATIQKSFEGGTGSEALRSLLARMQPSDLGLEGGDGALNRFQLSLLTEGSGTQIYSTTFVQWGAREILRRAQPVTLVARFAPRQRESDMRELLAEAKRAPALDPAGSLIDADMGAYYTWLNQQRLPGAESASFLAWFEDHGEAVLIAPGAKKNTADGSRVTVKQLLAG